MLKALIIVSKIVDFQFTYIAHVALLCMICSYLDSVKWVCTVLCSVMALLCSYRATVQYVAGYQQRRYILYTFVPNIRKIFLVIYHRYESFQNQIETLVQVYNCTYIKLAAELKLSYLLSCKVKCTREIGILET